MGDGPGFWRTLDGVLGGQTISEVRDGHAAQQRAARTREFAEGFYRDLKHRSPEEAAFFKMDPEGYFKAIGTRYEQQVVGDGDTALYGPGGRPYTAPKTGVDGGYGYTQTPGGTTWHAGRSMSHQETINDYAERGKVGAGDKDRKLRYAELQQKRQQEAAELAEDERANRAGEANDRATQARLRADSAGGGGGGYMPPGGQGNDLGSYLEGLKAELSRRKIGGR